MMNSSPCDVCILGSSRSEKAAAAVLFDCSTVPLFHCLTHCPVQDDDDDDQDDQDNEL